MRAALAITRKDLLLEMRGREVVVILFVFAFLVLTLFSLSASPGSEALSEMAPGILWITFLFAGVLGLGRNFDRERENDCFQGLLLAPCDPTQIYWGKCLSTLIFMLVFQALLWPLFSILYGFSPLRGGHIVWTAFLLGDIGFVALGVLLSAIAIHIRSREIVLPLLLFPLCLPVLLGGVQCTASAMAGGGFREVAGWLGRLAAFDVIFISLGSILFPFVVEE
ncbi:MAG: heme exporter protein CcmB [bacterium]|nr:MAG: heme exporter protein CcmB [bacterium]